MNVFLHVTFEFYLINLNNISITVMYKNADSVTRGLCVISFPLHPHRGAGSQTSARRQAFIWFRELPPLMCLLCSWSVPVWNVCIITLLTEIDASPNHLHMQQSSTWMNLIAGVGGGGGGTFRSWKIQGMIVLTLDVSVWGEHMFGREKKKVL